MQYTEKDVHRIGGLWLQKIRQAEKREDKWIKDAENAEAAYISDNTGSTHSLPSFNILHSNVETIVPSIINSPPSPDIRPRHGVSDDPLTEVLKEVSDGFERAVNTQIDDNALEEEMEASAQDAFMAGRGIIRVKFDADVQEMVSVEPDGTETPIGEQVINERVIYENVSWRDYREGPAKRWDSVPWICFRHEVSEQERERLENPEFAKFYEQNDNVDEDKDCTVWEIWDKEKREVLFLIEESGRVLDVKPDPLELAGFFPIVKPVQPITATGKRVPVCPYAIYEKLAKELDDATRRINAVMKGLKVRGAIAGDGDIADVIAGADDNEIVTVHNIENIVAAGGLEKAVMWWPVEQAITVLQQLYVQREQIKEAIYEITGISDIVRGQSSSRETATAQQIKTEWGSLRIKKMQKLIQRQARDIIKLTVEIMSRHFSIQAISKAAGMQFSPQAQDILAQPVDHLRIDIETDSTIRADLTKSRGEMAQFLEGTAQFFSTMAPVVQSAPQAAGPLAKMYAAFARQFSLGKSAEDALDQFVEMAEQAASQPQPNPEAEKFQAEMQMKMQELQGKFGLEVEKLKLQAQNLGLDAEVKRADLALKQQELAHKGEQLNLDESKAEMDAAATFAEIDIERKQERPAAVGN